MNLDPGPALDALTKLVDKAGPAGATLMVVAVVLAVFSPVFAWIYSRWDIARRRINLDCAKFDHEKAQDDAALREHGALTARALRSGIKKAPKRGRGGNDNG